VAAIAPKLEQAELERSRRKPTGSLDAYDYYLRGMICSHAWTRAANREALTHFYRAIELDPHFAAAYGMAARSFAQRKTSSWVEDWEGEMREAERLAYLAIEFGRDDAVALATAGITIAFMIGRVEEGDRLIQRSLALNPGFAWGWLFGGWTAAWMGDADTAIARVEHAIALSPFDPNLPSMRRAIAFAHFVAGRYDEALRIAGEVPASPRNASLGIATLAASAAMLGDVPLAQGHLVELMSIERDLRLNNLRARFPLLHDADHQRFAEGLRLAGLPET